MKIDKKEYDKLIKKSNSVFRIIKILDTDKFIYWNNKTEEYASKMEEYRDDEKKYFENFKNAILSETERNKYCRISRKELILLGTLVKYHNSIFKDSKIYINNFGMRVKND